MIRQKLKRLWDEVVAWAIIGLVVGGFLGIVALIWFLDRIRFDF